MLSSRWLEPIGLHRPELRAWALYDWANSVFMTTVLQVFPIYFATVAAAGLARAAASERFYLATTVAVTIMAAVSPFLGALADHAGKKKVLLGVFLWVGAAGTAGLAAVGRGQWVLGAALFILGNVGAAGSIVFYESLLPHVARPDEVDRVSTAGFAVGYLGGGLLLGLNMLWMRHPQAWGLHDAAAAVRVSFLSAAVWWLVFSIPLFRVVPEPPAQPGAGSGSALRAAVSRLGTTLREVRGYRDAFLLLLAFMIYNDGVVTIIRLATAFGTEVGISPSALLGAVLMVQFVGVPCSFLFGRLAARVGARPAVLGGLVVYVAIALIGYRMHSAAEFFLLALMVGTVQGGVQALSRSLFATLVPRHRSSEFFGFFGVFEKFSGMAGPLLFTGAVASTGSSRGGILGLVGFFLLGGGLLASVDIERGRRTAREAEAAWAGRPSPLVR